MARLARVVAVDVPHHVPQRGNRREYILSSDAERMVYLDLLRQAVQLYPLSLIGYCLMSNHVHLIVIPHEADALALAFKRAHGQYASYWNASHASSGHAWQGRFYSCPLDPVHLWEALRYAELNPRGVGGRAASVELVQRRSALRYGRAGYLPCDGDVAAALVTFHLARIPGCLVNPNPILLLSASVRTAGVPLVQTSLLKSWNLRQLVPWLRGKVVAPPRSLSETKQC